MEHEGNVRLPRRDEKQLYFYPDGVGTKGSEVMPDGVVPKGMEESQ